ncbi:hypothetical protein ACN268_10945 [Micromonospora sp. WMMD735]|uniref:hypothetical protein n=1 Tax=Micromonospora sp. WMMD735 TaxID=3404130 RepID=UPI003B927F74
MRGLRERLNPAERRLRNAFLRGDDLDLGGTTHAVRAEFVADLLTRAVDRTAYPGVALRLRNATVLGRLDVRQADITMPVSITGSTFTHVLDLTNASAANLVLSECTLPGFRARLLQVRGDLDLTRCTITGEVNVCDARIGGSLTLDGSALRAAVEGPALAAARMAVTGDLSARAGFSAFGRIWLSAATVGGDVLFSGATVRNPAGPAIDASRLTVGGSFSARYGFAAEGGIILVHAQIGNQLNFTEARISTTDIWALHVGGAQIGSLWLTFAAPPVGRVRLSGLQADSIFDHPATWPAELDLIGCTYQLLLARSPAPRGAPLPPRQVTVRQRLDWLRRSPDGYAPQPYEQLAAQYRHNGQDQEARRVLLEKQRQRRAALNFPARILGYLLDGVVGYGYRTWLAGMWLVAFWAIGTLTFTVQPSTPRSGATPDHNPALQALDLLLPIVNLGHDGTWRPNGVSQYVAALLILVGWTLTTAVVAGITRVLNR